MFGSCLILPTFTAGPTQHVLCCLRHQLRRHLQQDLSCPPSQHYSLHTSFIKIHHLGNLSLKMNNNTILYIFYSSSQYLTHQKLQEILLDKCFYWLSDMSILRNLNFTPLANYLYIFPHYMMILSFVPIAHRYLCLIPLTARQMLRAKPICTLRLRWVNISHLNLRPKVLP